MPNKNKAACKRRKCQRSRSQRRRNNNRQNRTIRVGGFLSPVRWYKTRRANATARRDTNKDTYRRANLWSPLRKWRERNTVAHALPPAAAAITPAYTAAITPAYTAAITPASRTPAAYTAAAAAAASRTPAAITPASRTAVATSATPATPATDAYAAAAAVIAALPSAGKIRLPKVGEYEKLSESQKLSLGVIVANGVKGLESPHITWAAIQLLNSPQETALPPDVFNKMVDVIFIGNELHETIPGQGPVKIDRLNGRFKLISMIKDRDIMNDPDPLKIGSLNGIIDNHIANINNYVPGGNNRAAILSLVGLFSIFMTLRREIFCASLLWDKMNRFKFNVDIGSPIAIRCSKVTLIKLYPILTMYEKICTGHLDSIRLLGTMTEALRLKKIDDVSLPIHDISDIYEETGNRVLDKLLKYGKIMNIIV